MFPVGSSWLKGQVVAEINENSSLVLISQNTGYATPLLFQAACTLACQGQSVSYICPEPMSNLPTPVHGMPRPDPSCAKLITFLYLKTGQELLDFLSGIHEQSFLPQHLIVQELDKYAATLEEHYPERSIAKLCVMLRDVQQFISYKRDKSHLLVSASHSLGQPDRFTSVYQKYFKNCYHLNGKHQDGVDSMEIIPANKMSESTGLLVTTNDQIYLNKIIQCSGQMFLT